MSNKGALIVLSAPSGTGKSTLCRAILKLMPELQYSISATSRPKRPNEVAGKDYFFFNEEEFRKKEEQGEFLESANVFGHGYGTPRSFIETQLKAGKDVLLDVDVQGAKSIREKNMEGVFIFIIPPNIQTLADRLQKRKTESKEVIENRLNQARNEIELYSQYDYVVINDVLEDCLHQINAIILAEKCRVNRNLPVFEKLLTV